jgi:hypothetical protein
MQRPPLVAEEDAHSQAEPESDGDAAAGFEGGDARDACGLCEDQRGEGVGPAAKASAEAVLPPTLDGEEEPEECCLCMETFSDDALVSPERENCPEKERELQEGPRERPLSVGFPV